MWWILFLAERDNLVDGVLCEFSSGGFLVDVGGFPDADLRFVADLFTESTADSVDRRERERERGERERESESDVM